MKKKCPLTKRRGMEREKVMKEKGVTREWCTIFRSGTPDCCSFFCRSPSKWAVEKRGRAWELLQHSNQDILCPSPALFFLFLRLPHSVPVATSSPLVLTSSTLPNSPYLLQLIQLELININFSGNKIKSVTWFGKKEMCNERTAERI